jgi:microcystin-dependent protein
MSGPYLGEIKIVSFNFAPKGWALCNGQVLPIAQNQALFSLLGTLYGGDGVQTFALPDLQARTPMHQGLTFTLGQWGGMAVHAVTQAEMPSHYHPVVGTSATASQLSPAGNIWARSTANPYSETTNATLNPASVATQGDSQQHENKPPLLVLNYVISLMGNLPSRN